MRNCCDELGAFGHHVTSRWIYGAHEITRETTMPDEQRKRFATEDLEDLIAADCVISFTEPPRSNHSRGGRHVEFGIALTLPKRLIVIGYRENVFHWLPKVEFFERWEDALATLGETS